MDDGRWDDFAVNATLAGLKKRNEQAVRTIARYARNHVGFDIFIGLAGTFIPFGGLAALTSSILAQYPLVYEPMSRELAHIYTAKPDQITRAATISTAMLGAAGDIAAAIGIEFLQEIAGDLLTEMGLATAAASLPFVGGIAGMMADAVIASTLTWRVGTMIAIYYQNGGAWYTDRKTTFDKAKDMVGGYSAQTDQRFDLGDIPKHIPSIREKHIRAMIECIETMRLAGSDNAQIIAALKAKGFPEDCIFEAMRRSKG